MDRRITIAEIEDAVDKIGGKDGLQRLNTGSLIIRLAAAPAFPVFKFGAFSDYVVVSVRDLGLEEASYNEVCLGGVGRGLEFSGDAFYAEDFRELPDNVVLYLTTKGLIRNKGKLCIRAGSRAGGMFTELLEPGRRFNADAQFVFAVLRKLHK